MESLIRVSRLRFTTTGAAQTIGRSTLLHFRIVLRGTAAAHIYFGTGF